MKNKFKKSLIGLSVAATFFAASYTAFAFEDRSGEWQRHHYESHRQFTLGICVGQTLAQQGVVFPPPQPDQPPTLDSTTLTALQSAEQTCRAEMDGTASAPSPVPSASPTPVPSGTGSVPSPAPSPSPTDTGTPTGTVPTPSPSP